MLEELSLLTNRGSKMFKLRQMRVEKFIYENHPDVFSDSSMVSMDLSHSLTAPFLSRQPLNRPQAPQIPLTSSWWEMISSISPYIYYIPHSSSVGFSPFLKLSAHLRASAGWGVLHPEEENSFPAGVSVKITLPDKTQDTWSCILKLRYNKYFFSEVCSL